MNQQIPPKTITSKIIGLIGSIVRLIAIVFCSTGVLFFTILVFTSLSVSNQELMNPWPIFFTLDGLMVLFLYLLLRKKKPPFRKPNSENPRYVPIKNTNLGVRIQSEIISSLPPQEVFEDMRVTYTPIQAENDARIATDCIQLLQTTRNLDTFFSRYELGISKLLTMRQAEQAKIIKFSDVQGVIDSYYKVARSQKEQVLISSFEDEKRKVDSLSTLRGKTNRWKKYLELLQKYDSEFEFDCKESYLDIYRYVQERTEEFEGISNPSDQPF